MKDYRKQFKKHYQIEFNDKYDIHHIDLNHDNNDINNLMLLPKGLHKAYHSLLNEFARVDNFDPLIVGNRAGAQSETFYILKQLMELIEECNKWYDYKMFLNNEIPNIHRIELEL